MAYKRTEIAPDRIDAQLDICRRLRAFYEQREAKPLALSYAASPALDFLLRLH